MRQSRPVTSGSPRWIDRGISVLNGMVGDHLRRRGNTLAIEMACYRDGRPLELTKAELRRAHPDATDKVCVLVHGLGCNERLWGFREATDDATEVSYGSLLQRNLGYTPFYLRYNSGLPIAENGEMLAALLARLHDAYPGAIAEIVLIGHSMGGMLLRSACDVAHRRRMAWVRRVTRAVYLGTPHDGADLAKLTHVVAATLHSVPNPITRLIGDVINVRSHGVKDLGFDPAGSRGKSRPARGAPRSAMPWLATAQHYMIVGTLTRNPRHPASVLFGDALVRLPGGRQRAAPARRGTRPSGEHIKVFAGIRHLGLASNLSVYAQIERWCHEPATAHLP